MVETLLIASWFATLAICFVLVARPIVRMACGSGAAHSLWTIPIAVTLVSLFASRPAGPTIWISESTSTTAQPAAAPFLMLDMIWLVGVIVCGGILLLRQIRFAANLNNPEPLKEIDGVMISRSSGVQSATVHGVWRPQILLPANFREGATTPLIVQHELAHIRRHDTRANLLAELIRCVFWFNPFFHWAIHCYRGDQESACDERVLSNEPSLKRAYANALIDAASVDAPKTNVSLGAGWASPKRALAKRIRRLMKPSRPARLRATGYVAVFLCTLQTAAWTFISLPDTGPKTQMRSARATSIATMQNSELGKNLLYAVKSGDRQLVKQLIDAGAPLEHAEPDLGTPLILAAGLGHRDIAKLLVDRNANVNAAVLTAGSPLIMAAKHNRLDIAELLIDRGGDVNAHVFLDETPLINAARFGHVDMVKRLINAGANTDKTVVTFSITHLPLGTKSPISEATRIGHDDVVEVLAAGSS